MFLASRGESADPGVLGRSEVARLTLGLPVDLRACRIMYEGMTWDAGVRLLSKNMEGTWRNQSTKSISMCVCVCAQLIPMHNSEGRFVNWLNNLLRELQLLAQRRNFLNLWTETPENKELASHRACYVFFSQFNQASTIIAIDVPPRLIRWISWFGECDSVDIKHLRFCLRLKLDGEGLEWPFQTARLQNGIHRDYGVCLKSRTIQNAHQSGICGITWEWCCDMVPWPESAFAASRPVRLPDLMHRERIRSLKRWTSWNCLDCYRIATALLPKRKLFLLTSPFLLADEFLPTSGLLPWSAQRFELWPQAW